MKLETKPDIFIEQLQNALQRPLPGRAAQLSMAHALRLQELEKVVLANDHKLAGVVMLIFAEGDKLKTTLIARNVNPRDVHSGQISFPGGRIETTDKSIEAGALRELHEEVGVAPHEVQVLGALTELYIPVSKFLVHPFVAYSPTRPQFIGQDTEVIQILTPDLDLFLSNEPPKRGKISLSNGYSLENVPYFDVEGHTLWGATAMILGEFRALIAD